MALLDQVLSRKLVMVTGKGGIGKSTTAASIALFAAAHGRKVCVVESNSRDQIAPQFGHPDIGHKLTELAPRIFAINLNPQDNFRDFVVTHLGFARLFEKVFTKPIVQSFIKMLPGIAELTLLGRLYYFCELESEHQFDLVVLDGFASGHFLSLLKTPDAVLNSGMIGPVINETQKVRDFLFTSSQVAIILVTMPEELIVSEAVDFAQRFRTELDDLPMQYWVNRCLYLNANEWQQEAGEELHEEIAYQYLQQRAVRETANLDKLIAGLSAVYHDLEKVPRLQTLPDLGAIAEPLTEAAVQTWFAQAKGLKY